MPVETFDVVDGQGRTVGAVLADSVTGLQLEVSYRTFIDGDEAAAFVAWLNARRIDARALSQGEMRARIEEWRQPRDHAA